MRRGAQVFSLFQVRFLIAQWTLAGKLLEVFMKTREVMEAAFVTDLLDIHLVFDQEFAGVPNADFNKELRECLAGTRLEIAAKRVAAHAGHIGDFP